MEFPLKNTSLLPVEFTQKLDLEQEALDIDKFLEEDEGTSFNSDNSADFVATSASSAFNTPDTEDQDFVDFSKNYNTTGQYAETYKINQNNTQDSPVSTPLSPSKNQTNSWEISENPSQLQEEILTQLKTNNLYIRQLTETMQQSGRSGPSNLPEEIIAELKTNNLYLSRVELKISQLLRALERLFKP